MSFLKKPEKIYADEEDVIKEPIVETTTTTTEAPKRPNPQIYTRYTPPPRRKKVKIGFFKMVWMGIRNEEMENKEITRYEAFLTNLKIIGLTVAIGLCLLYVGMYYASTSTTHGDIDVPSRRSFMDKIIDFIVSIFK